MQGGASAQFALVPLNLAAPALRSGLHQYRTLVAQGDRGGAALLHGAHRRRMPAAAIPARAAAERTAVQRRCRAMLHYTPNETISGVEFGYVPEAARRAAGRGHVLQHSVAAHRVSPSSG